MAVFNWPDFNIIAATLAGNADEASLRSAVSRAYYAVFGSTRIRAKTETYKAPTDGTSTHKSLWDYYKSSTSQNRRQYGLDGDRLHRERLRADYHNPLPSAPASAAQQAVAEAARLLGILPNL